MMGISVWYDVDLGKPYIAVSDGRCLDTAVLKISKDSIYYFRRGSSGCYYRISDVVLPYNVSLSPARTLIPGWNAEIRLEWSSGCNANIWDICLMDEYWAEDNPDFLTDMDTIMEYMLSKKEYDIQLRCLGHFTYAEGEFRYDPAPDDILLIWDRGMLYSAQDRGGII